MYIDNVFFPIKNPNFFNLVPLIYLSELALKKLQPRNVHNKSSHNQNLRQTRQFILEAKY